MPVVSWIKNEFSRPQRYMWGMIMALFLPFYMCAAVHVFLCIRLLLSGDIQASFRKVKPWKIVIVFCAISLVTSLVYGNLYGAGCAVMILNMFALVFYWRDHITPDFFEFMTDVLLYMSIVAACYGLIEYIGIINKFDLDAFELIVFNTPQNRINSFFFNANYYAMLICFFVGIAVYKILCLFKHDSPDRNLLRQLFIWIITIFLNLFMLYLTGCRTAWPALIVGLVAILFFNHSYRLFGVSVALGGSGAAYLAMNPSKIPRISNIYKYLRVRLGIWRVAIANIKTHPIFGEGGMTYYHIYKHYGGHATQHAHNVYIDSVLSFGIVGVALGAVYFADVIKNVRTLYKSHKNDTLVGLMVGMTLMILVHGILDLTIFFVQTAFIYFLIINSYKLFDNDVSD